MGEDLVMAHERRIRELEARIAVLEKAIGDLSFRTMGSMLVGGALPAPPQEGSDNG